jgi:hypothetical protein
MKGDRVEVLVDAGTGSVERFEIVATRAGRRLEVTTGRGVVEVTEMTRTDLREYFRPNFWPNTPDILPEHLQYGGKPAFLIRLVLAATLSSNYGIYGPVFELCVQEALPGREEYSNYEKYEIKHWNRDRPYGISGSLKLRTTIFYFTER